MDNQALPEGRANIVKHQTTPSSKTGVGRFFVKSFAMVLILFMAFGIFLGPGIASAKEVHLQTGPILAFKTGTVPGNVGKAQNKASEDAKKKAQKEAEKKDKNKDNPSSAESGATFDLTGYEDEISGLYKLALGLALPLGAVVFAFGAFKMITGNEREVAVGKKQMLTAVIAIAGLILLPHAVNIGTEHGSAAGWTPEVGHKKVPEIDYSHLKKADDEPTKKNNKKNEDEKEKEKEKGKSDNKDKKTDNKDGKGDKADPGKNK